MGQLNVIYRFLEVLLIYEMHIRHYKLKCERLNSKELIDGLSSARKRHKRQPDVDILILGAGYAGLGAAKTLYDNNVRNFTILEAKDYIGGRVHDVKFGNETLPMGAGYLQRTETNHVLTRLAKKYNLKTTRVDFDFNAISFRDGNHGYSLDQSYVQSNVNLLRRSLYRCIEHRDEKDEIDDYEMSLRDCLHWGGWYKQALKGEPLREAIGFMMFDWENAGSPDDMSASQMAYTGEGDSSFVTDPRGYSYPILQEIKPFRNKIQLQTEIKRIKRTRDKRYKVITSDKRIFHANRLIVTFSSGVLLSENVKFHPPLPAWKMNALKKVPMGHYCKFFFKFPYQFWEKNSDYILLSSKERGYFSLWHNLNFRGLFPGSNTLSVVLTGDLCVEKQLQTDDEIVEEAMFVLRQQIEYQYAPNPIEFKRNKWSLDPHVMGAYSLPSPGITPEDYEDLERPIENLWFSGEYASMNNFGFAHGAYEHGEKIAMRLMKSSHYKSYQKRERTDDIQKARSISSACRGSTISSLFILLILCFHVLCR